MATPQSLPERGEGIVSKLSPGGTDTQEFKDWLEKLEDLYKNPEKDKHISDEAYAAIGTSLKPLENAIDAVNKKEIFEIVEAGVILVANIASLAGTLAGINLAWVLPVCKIFLGIAGVFISRSEQKKTESVVLQIKRTIKKELTDFKFELLGEEISRVMRVGELMAMDLNHFLSNLTLCKLTPCKLCKLTQCKLYEGFSEISRYRLDELYLCMDNLKDIAGKKFLVLKEERTDKKIGFTYIHDYYDTISTECELLKEDTISERNKHAKQCLMCITAYCNLASIYIMLLNQHKILSHIYKNATGLIDIRLKKIFDEAKEFLAFLPDSEMLAPIGWWEGKLRVMYNYRKTPNYYRPIKRFLGMIGLPETLYSIKEARYALDLCLHLAAYKVRALEPRFSELAVDDVCSVNDTCTVVDIRMRLVNNTRWPVCIFGGIETTKLDDLKYGNLVEPRRTHTQSCLQQNNGSFASSGIITVGERLKPLSDMGYVQYIEFALSNPTMSSKKIYTNPVDSSPRSTQYSSYKPNLHSHDKAKSFTYDGQFCIVRGEIKREKVWSYDDADNEIIVVYQFVIEEFDHDKLQQQTMDPFRSIMAVYKATLRTSYFNFKNVN